MEYSTASERILILFVAIAITIHASAQKTSTSFIAPSTSYNASRVNGVIITEAAVGTGAFISLHFLWYKKYSNGKFHFFNDFPEWLQMDKLGHATTAYNLSAIGSDVYRWTGMGKSEATWMGGLTGLLFLTTIEIFDGFSSNWGFSCADMVANIAGTSLAMGQNFAWNDQRIQLRFSYHTTLYPSYRPDELGENFLQSILKDYNGQSYWLSGNLYSLLNQRTTSTFPKWLDISLGYGAEGMISGRVQTGADTLNRQRLFFISADADLSKINFTSNVTSTLATTLMFVKVPAPALEYKGKQKKYMFRPIYY